MTLVMTEDNCPEFTIKATDQLAPAIIQAWIVLAQAYKAPKAKIDSAARVLEAAREWQRLNRHKVKIPD
jgi:hypothetical protein